MDSNAIIHQVLSHGLRYSFDADAATDLRELAKRTVNKLDRAEYMRGNTNQIAGYRQVLPLSFDEALTTSVKERNMAPSLSAETRAERRKQRWNTAYGLVVSSLNTGNSDNSHGGVKDRAYSTITAQLADDFYGTGEATKESLFHTAVITEILGPNSPWRLKDAKAYWCSLLAAALDISYSRLDRYDWATDYVLIAMASLARIERRLGNYEESQAILNAIAKSQPTTIGDNWDGVDAELRSAKEFLSAIASPHLFEHINPYVWQIYVDNR